MQSVEPKFTDDLTAHLIEWITYFIMQDYPIAAVCTRDKTPTEFFETENWNFWASRVPHESIFLLLDVGVIQNVEGINLITHRASCSFSEIKKTVKTNLHQLKDVKGLERNNYVFKIFLRVAHFAGNIPSSENEYFHVDPFWEKMFDDLISHKLVNKKADRYYWQRHIHPRLENYMLPSTRGSEPNDFEPITWRWFG